MKSKKINGHSKPKSHQYSSATAVLNLPETEKLFCFEVSVSRFKVRYVSLCLYLWNFGVRPVRICWPCFLLLGRWEVIFLQCAWERSCHFIIGVEPLISHKVPIKTSRKSVSTITRIKKCFYLAINVYVYFSCQAVLSYKYKYPAKCYPGSKITVHHQNVLKPRSTWPNMSTATSLDFSLVTLCRDKIMSQTDYFFSPQCQKVSKSQMGSFFYF